MKSLNLYLIPVYDPISVVFHMPDHYAHSWLYRLNKQFLMPTGEFGVRFDKNGALVKLTKI